MRKIYLLLTSCFLITAAVTAQEKAEVTVTIKNDGEVVKDTTYSYDNIQQAEDALHILDVMNREELKHLEHADNMHVKVKKIDADDEEEMIFISKEGEITELKGDGSKIWISGKDEMEKENVKVFKVETDEEGEEHVIIHEPGDDDEAIEVIIKKIKEGDAEKVKKEMIISGDLEGENGSWTVKEEDGVMMMVGEDGETIELKKEFESKDGKEVKWVSEDGDDMKVFVIKKKTDDDDVDVEVEVEVEQDKIVKDDEHSIPKKEKKKSKK